MSDDPRQARESGQRVNEPLPGTTVNDWSFWPMMVVVNWIWPAPVSTAAPSAGRPSVQASKTLLPDAPVVLLVHERPTRRP